MIDLNDELGWITHRALRCAGAIILLLAVHALLTGCGGISSLIPEYVPQGIILISGSHFDSKQEADPENIKCDAQRWIKERFGVYITNNAADIPAIFWYPLEAQGMSDADFITFAEALLPEFDGYTREFFANAEVSHIFVAKRLISNGTNVGGLACNDGVLCLVYTSVFHHELYHMADNADGGSDSNNNIWPWSERDTDVSGQEVIGTMESHGMNLGWLKAGFVSEYAARSNANEDQATFFELCISDRYDQSLFHITGISEEVYGNDAKSVALDKLMEMSQLGEVSPLVILKIRDTLGFFARISA